MERDTATEEELQLLHGGSTAIDDGTREARIDAVLDVAERFRLDRREAVAVLSEVVTATGRWRRAAADGRP